MRFDMRDQFPLMYQEVVKVCRECVCFTNKIAFGLFLRCASLLSVLSGEETYILHEI